MSGMSKYAMGGGDNFIGKQTDSFKPHISLKGSGIATQHCTVNY